MSYRFYISSEGLQKSLRKEFQFKNNIIKPIYDTNQKCSFQNVLTLVLKFFCQFRIESRIYKHCFLLRLLMKKLRLALRFQVDQVLWMARCFPGLVSNCSDQLPVRSPVQTACAFRGRKCWRRRRSRRLYAQRRRSR